MSHYSDDPSSCRVDFFKPSGKWYSTEAIVFPPQTYNMHPADALKTALRIQIKDCMKGMAAVCLLPYVENPFPVLIKLE